MKLKLYLNLSKHIYAIVCESLFEAIIIIYIDNKYNLVFVNNINSNTIFDVLLYITIYLSHTQHEWYKSFQQSHKKGK